MCYLLSHTVLYICWLCPCATAFCFGTTVNEHGGVASWLIKAYSPVPTLARRVNDKRHSSHKTLSKLLLRCYATCFSLVSLSSLSVGDRFERRSPVSLKLSHAKENTTMRNTAKITTLPDLIAGYVSAERMGAWMRRSHQVREKSGGGYNRYLVLTFFRYVRG